MTTLQKFREALQLSRAKFALLTGKAESTIEKLESEVGSDFAKDLARIAAENGRPDFQAIWEATARGEDVSIPVDVPASIAAGLLPDQRRFLESCLWLYNTRAADADAGSWVDHTLRFASLLQRLAKKSKGHSTK